MRVKSKQGSSGDGPGDSAGVRVIGGVHAAGAFGQLKYQQDYLQIDYLQIIYLQIIYLSDILMYSVFSGWILYRRCVVEDILLGDSLF